MHYACKKKERVVLICSPNFVGLPDKTTDRPVAHSWPGSVTLDQGEPNASQALP